MKMNQVFRRTLSLLLCLCMVLSTGFTPSAAYEPATRGTASAFESTKNINNGGDNDPETYTIDIDALVNGSVTEQVSSEPLDVSIVFDRSDSMSFPADPDAVKTFTSYNQVKTFLNSLNPDQLWDGYYRASNIAHTGAVLYGDRAVESEKYISWEPIRYNKTSKTWETFITEGAGGINGIEGPHGIVRSKASRYAPYYGKWVSLETAFNTFKSRQSYVTKTAGVKFSIAIPCLTKAQIALEEFIRGLDKTADNLPANQNHTVSVVSFGGSVFINNYLNELDGKNWTYKDTYSGEQFVHKTSISKQTLAGSRGTTAQKNAVNSLINDIIRNPYTQGPTYTNLAFEYLAGNAKYLPAAATGRNRVVILLTDGTPTDSMLFLKDYANSAINTALGMKNSGVSIYTLGFMKGIKDNGTYLTHADSNSEARKAQNFLHLMSSNYPKASSMTAPGSMTGKNYFMADTGDGTNLLGHFKSILEKISMVYVSPLPGAKDSVSIYDEITREFVIDTDKKVKVYIQKYNGNGSFAATKEYIGEHSLSATEDATFNGPNGAYKLYWDCDIDKSDPDQPGVDLNISSIRLNWLDAKYAALRENAVTNAGSSYPSYTKGYKIGIELPIEVDDNNTMGGNNILTNTAVSGLYKSTTDDTTNQPDFTKNEIKYPSPNVNVEADFSTLVYDYFMDLETFVANQNAGANSSFAQKIFAAMLQDPSALLNYLNNNKNDYVNLSIQLEDLYALLANAGADAFTSSGAASGATFVYTIDQMLDALVKLTYTSNETDSVGVAPFQNVTTTLNPNYYGPKYVVVDFDETVKVPLDNEADAALAAKVIDNKYGTIENGEICYDFRENYGSGDKEYLEGDYKTVQYQVTAINAPKAQNGNKTVARNFYVFPANVMTYDDTFLDYKTQADFDPEDADDAKQLKKGIASWESVGTPVDDEQTYDNALIHGYDELYNGGAYSHEMYHNAMTAVTVSKEKGIAQATFTFVGTGFDIFAQTSPNSGAMTVEVCRDESFKSDFKTFIVDTYLKDTTLNQIPVVRLDGLDYDTWYVRITAFYDSIFDHNYVSQWRSGAITEEKLRERYNIPADADFTFIPSASGYDHPATRVANAANGQYNVYIDGIRVYNTLGTSLDAVEAYAYKQADEGVAKIMNINDELVDFGDYNSWNGNEVSGVLYIAAESTSAGYGDLHEGIILGLKGELLTEKGADEKLYLYYYEEDENGTLVKKPVLYTETVEVPVLDDKGEPTGEMESVSTDYPVYCVTEAQESPNGRPYTGISYYYNSKKMTTRQIWAAFGTMPAYYNAKYSAMGPEKEVYLGQYTRMEDGKEVTGDCGVAFNVPDGAKVMLSFKSHDGEAASLQIYNGSGFVTLAPKDYDASAGAYTTTSRVEMYYDITDYVVGGSVYVKRGTGIPAICNIKTIGAGPKSISVDAALAVRAAEIFEKAALPVDDSAQIMHTLDLASDISLNYVVPTAKLADYDYSYMEVTFKGETFIVEPEIRGAFGYFTVDGITAVDMTEELTATLHLFFGEEEFVSETDVYSVADYAYAQLNKADVSEELKAVCANLLRYGALAQSFKGSVAAPADAAMTAEQKAYVTDLNTVSVNSVAKALGDVENGIAWAGKALVLDSKVAIKAIFNLKDYAGNKEALNLRVSYTNAEGEEITLVMDTMEVYSGEYYAFVVDTLLATEMRSELAMALYEGDVQVSETQIYSVESYCVGKTGALADLGKALLAYSDAAKAFFAK